MRAIGRISNITVDYSAKKQSREGVEYTNERVTLYFEAGDDTHMVQVFNNVFAGDTSESSLRKRHFFVGARGEMILNYGVREYQGRNYPDVSLTKWTCDNANEGEQPKPEPTPQPAPQPAPQPVEEAAAVEGDSKLPF